MVWWGICTWLCYKFPTETNSERILKIGQYLVKLWARVKCLVFFDSQCSVKRRKHMTGGLAGRQPSECLLFIQPTDSVCQNTANTVGWRRGRGTFTYTHTRLTALCLGLPAGSPRHRVSQYQKGKTSLDFTEARDSEWQWHQLGHTHMYASKHLAPDR